MEEELAAGELAESVEGPKNLSDSAEGYIPVQWTRKKIALAVAVGVVMILLFAVLSFIRYRQGHK